MLRKARCFFSLYQCHYIHNMQLSLIFGRIYLRAEYNLKDLFGKSFPFQKNCLGKVSHFEKLVREQFLLLSRYIYPCGVQLKSDQTAQQPLYEAKLPFSEWCGTMKSCNHALELLQNYYHTSGLSKEVFNFVVPQGAQKIPAKVQMKSPIY